MNINYDGDGDVDGIVGKEGNAWDDTEGAGADEEALDEEDDDEEDESRELTHEEIWDDSALVAAWDAAVEEYEVRCLHCL